MILIAGIVIFGSCKKESDDPGNPDSNGSMSLKHDGESWTPTLGVQGVNTNGVINITGSDSKANQVAIVVFEPTGPGTYKIGPSGNAGTSGRWTQGIGQLDSYMASHVIGSGEVTFTELTTAKAKGTFKFTAYNTEQATVVVTEGKFDIAF